MTVTRAACSSPSPRPAPARCSACPLLPWVLPCCSWTSSTRPGRPTISFVTSPSSCTTPLTGPPGSGWSRTPWSPPWRGGQRLDPGARSPRPCPRLARGQSVAAVAAEVGWSRRHLTTQVGAELGLSPKAYQRVARFQTAHRRLHALARTGRPSLAAVAADTGYADQAHLTREWVELGGCTPARWLREEFPFVQDSPLAGDDDGTDGTDPPRRAPATEGH